jgi:DNA-3-methyladenine glycosylase I
MNSSGEKNLRRCHWARTDPSIAYHDREWGVPVHDDRTLFEFLVLEGAQAGLSWETILRKRDNYRQAFDDFAPAKVAKYDQRRIAKLMTNECIVRNRMKVNSAV